MFSACNFYREFPAPRCYWLYIIYTFYLTDCYRFLPTLLFTADALRAIDVFTVSMLFRPLPGFATGLELERATLLGFEVEAAAFLKGASVSLADCIILF